MWSQRDPRVRISGVGNLFIKIAPTPDDKEEVDEKRLMDIFSVYGNILSCKVGRNRDTGKSKG